MKIFEWGIKVSKEDLMQQYDFRRFEKQCGDFYLVEARFKYSILDEINDKKVVNIQGEEPNRFMSSDPAFRGDKYDTYFYKIFTVCPYTAEWLNNIQGTNRREVAYLPINEHKIPLRTKKKYDIIYVGNVNSKEINKSIDIIKKFNYRFVARTNNYGLMSKLKYKLGIPLDDKRITNQGVDYKTKMQLLAESKIALVHGVLWCYGETLRAAWSTPMIEDHKAFSLIPRKTWVNFLWSFVSRKEYLVPQFKTRFFESAVSRTLILCRKDPFNIIERFLTPDKEFVYYEDGKLQEKIVEILDNWEKYEPVIENAYNRVTREYTTQTFFNKYLKNLK